MRIAMFYHSLLSDWNHGNAHFLRGVSRQLLARGHYVRVYEPRDNWSIGNLLAEHGTGPIDDFRRHFPMLSECSVRYDPAELDIDAVVAENDLVIVHEWNDQEIVRRISRAGRRTENAILLFHDTHHRAVTDSASMARYDLSGFAGTLAFGQVIRDIYLARGWSSRAWTWHEAADVELFRPLSIGRRRGDLVWIGNWGDDERSAELDEFLIEPVRRLRLRARVYGVRYPPEALERLAGAGIEYGGWLPNYRVPEIFAGYRVTVHVPRRPYVRDLPGIPTIRPFEALACGIPLVCSPWNDAEGLFKAGRDFLVADDGRQMTHMLGDVLNKGHLARRLAEHGRLTILARHTCSHRVEQLLSVLAELSETTDQRSRGRGSVARIK